MKHGPVSGFENSIYYAPHDDEGAYDAAAEMAALAIASEFMPDDYDIVGENIEEFMTELYGTARHSQHNNRMLAYYRDYAEADDDAKSDPATSHIDRMTIVMGDFVEHAILNPEKTAVKLSPSSEPAAEIKADALARLSELLEGGTDDNQEEIKAVADPDALIKAYLFAIDSSKWESAARIWRDGGADKIGEMLKKGEINERESKMLTASVYKTPELDNFDKAELEQVLKTKGRKMVELKLRSISVSTLNHNIKGVFFKGLETKDLIENPPPNNPASTFRDCIEALNFFVPALMALGYKKLAIDLRGAALEWLYDDPNGHAKRQHDLSHRHRDDIQEIVTKLRETEFSGIEVESEARVKSEGSLREKLAQPKYEGIHLTPDGVGMAFIVPNKMAGAEMTHFAEQFMKRLTADPARIQDKHPAGEPAFDDMQGARRRKSGYEAIHMTFYYYPEPGSLDYPDAVPFEIQVLTQRQHWMKMYGRSSDLFYKARGKYTDYDQQHLNHLAERARAEREIGPGTTIQSIAEMLAVSPHIPFVFNKLFRAVDGQKGTRTLVPKELAKLAPQMLAEALGDSGNLAVLPAAKLSEEQFIDALSMFGRDLATDKNILNALQLVKESEANTMRDDGVTSVLEGHILPTALAAVMLATQSGKVWDDEGLGPNQYAANIAATAILHDHVENALEGIGDQATKLAKRQEMLFEIKQKFGSAVMDGVNAMTYPFEVEDEYARREQYSIQIQDNEYARLVKPADRWQNHITDLIKLATGQAPQGSADWQKIMEYFAKTDQHLSEDFTSPELSDVYARVHKLIWQYAKHFGYQAQA